MATIRVNGVALYYESTGSGEDVVVFAPGLAWGTLLFRAQVAALSPRYRCLVYEPRGQGRSQVPRGGYELDNQAVDLAELINRLAGQACHLVGHSLGGSAAVRVAARRPELVRSLALLNATVDEDPLWDRVLFRTLSHVVDWFGMGAVDERLVETMFGVHFRNDPARAALVEEARRQFLANDRHGIARAVRGWIRSPAVLDRLPDVSAPTLVLAGAEDTTVKPERSRLVAERVQRGRFVLLPQCGHAAPFEAPEAVNAVLAEWFTEAATHQPAVGA